MSADGSLFIYPTGKSPEQLYSTLKVLIDRLNQVKSQDATNLTAINEAIEAATNDLQELLDALSSWDPEGGLTPQQAFELSLVTAVDSMMGSVSNAVLESIRRSEEAAQATIKALLAGLTNKGEIRVEQVVRKTENESFVSQLSTFNAQLGNAQSAISNEIIARTNGDSALAGSISSLSTTVNGNTAQIVILASSVNGIEQKFAVALNENGHVTGLLQLDGTPIGTGFTVVADKHQLAFPGINGGDPFPMFVIEEIDEVPTAIFNGLLKVLSLDAFSANLGTVTAGRMLSPLGKVDFSLDDDDPYLKITTGS